MSVCEVCGRSDGDRLVWSVKRREGEVEPSSPVHVWKLCDYRHHALCVRCLREVEDAVALDGAGDAACSDMLVAESLMIHARSRHVGDATRPDVRDVVAMATEDCREARVVAYEHHRKAMARLRAQHEAARAKGPEA